MDSALADWRMDCGPRLARRGIPTTYPGLFASANGPKAIGCNSWSGCPPRKIKQRIEPIQHPRYLHHIPGLRHSCCFGLLSELTPFAAKSRLASLRTCTHKYLHVSLSRFPIGSVTAIFIHGFNFSLVCPIPFPGQGTADMINLLPE
jgi:hypothetical protein